MKFQFAIAGRRGLWSAGLLALVLLAAPLDLQAAESKPMTIARPAESVIVPLFNSMNAFDKAVDANGGKPPKDARQQLKKFRRCWTRLSRNTSGSPSP